MSPEVSVSSISATEQKEVLQPQGAEQKDSAGSGTTSEVLSIRQLIGDLITLGTAPMWSWHEETAQRLHEHPAVTNGHRELKAQGKAVKPKEKWSFSKMWTFL